MASTFSAEFENTPAGRASIGRVVQDLLAAERQFTVSPRFDVGPQGLHTVPGFTVSWPGAPVAGVQDETPSPEPSVA